MEGGRRSRKGQTTAKNRCMRTPFVCCSARTRPPALSRPWRTGQCGAAQCRGRAHGVRAVNHYASETRPCSTFRRAKAESRVNRENASLHTEGGQTRKIGGGAARFAVNTPSVSGRRSNNIHARLTATPWRMHKPEATCYASSAKICPHPQPAQPRMF